MKGDDGFYHFIYKTVNLITNEFYIGFHSTTNLNDSYLGSGLRIRRSVKKYGKENHIREILEFFPNKSLMIQREVEIVNENLIKQENCLNLTLGGNGGWSYVQNSEALKNARKMNLDWSDRKHSEETKQKLKDIRAKQIQHGQKGSMSGTCWISHQILGSKTCKVELLSEYLNQGWIKGRNLFKIKS